MHGEHRDVVHRDEPTFGHRLQATLDVIVDAPGHCGVGEAGRDDVHPDVARCELERQAAAHRMHARLGGDIRQELRARANRERRPARQQGTAQLGHVRHRRAKGEHHTSEVDREHPVPLVQIELVDRRAPGEGAGVREYGVQPPERIREVVNRGGER
jgi:hypothetical protein